MSTKIIQISLVFRPYSSTTYLWIHNIWIRPLHLLKKCSCHQSWWPFHLSVLYVIEANKFICSNSKDNDNIWLLQVGLFHLYNIRRLFCCSRTWSLIHWNWWISCLGPIQYTLLSLILPLINGLYLFMTLVWSLLNKCICSRY